MSTTKFESAIDLATQNGVRFPNESGDYREARDALLAEEIELRRHIKRVESGCLCATGSLRERSRRATHH